MHSVRRWWGLETSTNPFSAHPAWVALSHLSPAERYDRLKRDPELRRTLTEERPRDEQAIERHRRRAPLETDPATR